jgi:hypothetical protein
MTGEPLPQIAKVTLTEQTILCLAPYRMMVLHTVDAAHSFRLALIGRGPFPSHPFEQRQMHDNLMNLPIMATVVRLRVHEEQRSLVRADGSRFTALLNANFAALYPDRAMRFCSLSSFPDPSVPSRRRRTLLQTDDTVDVTTSLDLVVPPTAAPTGTISLSFLFRPSLLAQCPTSLHQLPPHTKPCAFHRVPHRMHAFSLSSLYSRLFERSVSVQQKTCQT